MIDQEKIHNQCLNDDLKECILAIEQLKIFPSIADKQQAWADLHRLTNYEDSYVIFEAAYAIGSAFSQVPDKQQAWDDLVRLINDEYSFVGSVAKNLVFLQNQ